MCIETQHVNWCYPHFCISHLPILRTMLYLTQVCDVTGTEE